MDRHRYNEIRIVYEEALGRPREERLAFLDAQCADDPILRNEVQALLDIADRSMSSRYPLADVVIDRAREEIDAVLDGPATEDLPPPVDRRGTPQVTPHLSAGLVIDGYTIERLIGTGGMGAVYAATQDRPKRRVALKLVRPELASARLLRRFEVESELLGRLQHPGIARIYDAGVARTPTGSQPYFAMEFVDGQPLDAYASSHALGTRDRLGLIAKIADAVGHAHQNGVIHRDLKPGNILVDASGQPKILDFGVARATDADLQATTMRTDVGAIIGTLAYMSPEQASGDPDELDTRSDVYALGVVAFQLLADRLPYELDHRLLHEAVRIIREDPPTSLSTVDRTLRGDVETIIAKALEKEKPRRYQSAADFASDIRRYLTNLPISARPASTWYQLRTFSRRNKTLVGGIAATMFVLVAGVITSAAFAYNAAVANSAMIESLDERDEALDNETKRADELQRVVAFQQSQLMDIDAARMGVMIRRDLLERRRDTLSERPEPDIDAGVATLDQALAGVNFTNVALKMLDDSIFVRAIETIDTSFADSPTLQARLYGSLATTMHSLGAFEAAADLETRTIAVLDGHAEGQDQRAMSQRRRATSLWELGQYDEAAKLANASYETLRAARGAADVESLRSRFLVASLAMELADYETAQTEMNAVLEDQMAALGEEHPDTLQTLHRMGQLMHHLGDFPAASSFYDRAVAGRRRALGDDHPLTIESMRSQLTMRSIAGENEAVAVLQEELLDVIRQARGDDHPDTINTMGALARTYSQLRRMDESEALRREALAIARRTLGEDHPTTIGIIGNLGSMLDTSRRYEEAEEYLLAAIEAGERVRGRDHPSHGGKYNNYGVLLMRLKRHDEAEAAFLRSIELVQSREGEHGRMALGPMLNYSRMLRKLGRVDDALPYYRHQYKTHESMSGPDGEATLLYKSEYAELLADVGRADEGEPLARDVYERAIEVVDDAVLVNILRSSNGYVLMKQMRFADAEPLLLEAHRQLSELTSPTSYLTRPVTERIVALYDAWHAAEPDAGHDASATSWREDR